MADQSIEDRIKLVLSREAMVDRKPGDIPEHARLIDNLGLDSVRIVELIVGLEDEFGMVIADEDLSLELFENVASLARFIRARTITP
jgi:acyl carrier protein